MNNYDNDVLNSQNDSYSEEDLQEDNYYGDINIIKDTLNVVVNFGYNENDSEAAVSYKRKNAQNFVTKLSTIKSYPEEKRPDCYADDYKEICSNLRNQEAYYIHREVLDRIIDSYNNDIQNVSKTRLKFSDLNDTLFFLELFSEITDENTESSILSRYPSREDFLKIKKKVADLKLADARKDSKDILNTQESTVKSEQKVTSEEYLDEVFHVYDRLDSTVSELGMLRKNDSSEFVVLMTTAKKLSELRDKQHISNEKMTPAQLDSEPDMLMSTLYEQTQKYIAHCTSDPKGGSRRKSRLKNAHRLLNVCEAYQKKVTVRDVLQDKIAESLLIGLTDTEKANQEKNGNLKEAAALELNYANPEWRKNEVDNRIKPSKTFKALMDGAQDTFDLYHMLEKTTETYAKFCKIHKENKNKQNVGEHPKQNIARSKSADCIKK